MKPIVITELEESFHEWKGTYVYCMDRLKSYWRIKFNERLRFAQCKRLNARETNGMSHNVWMRKGHFIVIMVPIPSNGNDYKVTCLPM